MFVQPSARRSLSLPRATLLRRPQLSLSTRGPSLRAPTTSRLLVTRPDLLWRKKDVRVGHGAVHERSLATAVEDTGIGAVPFGLPLYGQPPSSGKLAPYELRYFDPSKPLIVKADQDALPRTRTSATGIPGDVESMLSVFEACLHVQHLTRAELVLKRFDEMDCLPHFDLMNLHNRYLRATLEKMHSHPDPSSAESMQGWYEARIRAQGLPQTPETIACMLKFSILSTKSQDRLQQRINRYMAMAPGNTAWEVFSMSDILNAEDLDKIMGLCTTHNFPPDDWVLEQEQPRSQQAETEVQAAVSPASSETDPNAIYGEVRSVEQKGLGLKTLKGILSFFDGVHGSDISQLPLAEQREIQARLEKDSVEAAINRWRQEHDALTKMGRNTSLSTNALNSQLYEWQTNLEIRIKKDLAMMEEAELEQDKTADELDYCLMRPFLQQSTPTRLAAISILSLMNSTALAGADSGPSLTTAVQQLSKAVEDDIRLQQRQLAEKMDKTRMRVVRQTATQTPSGPSVTDILTDSNVVEPPAFDTSNWPVTVRTKLGAFLLSSFLDTAKISVVREHPETKAFVSQIQPAFAKTIVFRRGKKIGMVMPNKFLVDLMKREPRGDVLAKHLPMLVQPEPWSKFDKGGFLEFPSTLIRVKNGEKDQKVYADAAIKRGDLEQVCKGLDVLGRTAWKINTPVFEVMLEAWNTGEAIANLPPLHPNIPLPEEPENSEDPMAKRQWIKAVKAVENEKSGLHSERCFMNFQMEIANAFKEQTFYFPHNMDFRGRAYPIPTYLNHMSADNARGLLRFAKGKELGENGLRWLKVHLANVFGFDKASISEREQFTMENLDNVIESATNPLKGNRWWLKAEDQWQCLAACFEVKAAMELPDPTKYVSSLPVHQDGTCNGLQHYAALGGDVWGAQQVNLEPGDRPADVYSAVAKLVKEGIAEDAEGDNPLAKVMDGKITRKVVKQTVMTNVYGVTFIGARAQVQKQIEAAYPNIQAQTGYQPIMLASYVATKIFKALSTMFRGAHDIQYWLGECAGRVCRALTPEQLDRLGTSTLKTEENGKKGKGRPRNTAQMSSDILSQFRSTIIWTTPLRLPVVQPYRKSGIRVISTALQDLNITIPERSDPVNRRKQLQAFPPNFIHSLDATHMLLSALECNELGLSFAAVHDSFWTHAADIDSMNRVLRDSFIRIHSEDVIQRLASEFEARYKGSLYFAKIENGSLEEKKITAHRQKANITLQDEILQERERLQLLQSSDPAEVQRGKEMTTPASIFEAHSCAQAPVARDEIAEVRLGRVPSAEDIVQDVVKSEEGDGEAKHYSDPEALKEFLSMTGFEASLQPKKTKPSVKSARFNGVWLPLTLPELPKKGDFDVNRLKSSQYFFS